MGLKIIGYLNLFSANAFILTPLIMENISKTKIFQLGIIYYLFVLNLSFTSLFLSKSILSDRGVGDKYLIIGPSVINLNFIVIDIIGSFVQSNNVLSSHFIDLIMLNFITLILVFYFVLTKPGFLQPLPSFIQTYIILWYFVTLYQAYIVDLLSRQSLIVSTIILIPSFLISIIYEVRIHNNLMTTIISSLVTNQSINLSLNKEISQIRHTNLVMLANFVSQIDVAFDMAGYNYTAIPLDIDNDIVLFRSDRLSNNPEGRVHQSNMFLAKGKLYQIFYSNGNSSGANDRKFFERTLFVVLTTSLILFLTLLDFNSKIFLSSYDNLLFGSILISTILVIYFFYLHPVFKDLIPLIFGEEKFMIFEKGILTNIPVLKDDLRFIKFEDIEDLRFETSLKLLNIVIDRYTITIEMEKYLKTEKNVDEFHQILNEIDCGELKYQRLTGSNNPLN